MGLNLISDTRDGFAEREKTSQECTTGVQHNVFPVGFPAPCSSHTFDEILGQRSKIQAGVKASIVS